MASKIAHFPALRDLDGFDFAAQPSLDPRQIRELAACRWVARGEALLLLGPPGVGKTHLAIALGPGAIREDCSVLFTTAPALVAALAKAYAEGRLKERLGFFAKPKLLYAPIIGAQEYELFADSVEGLLWFRANLSRLWPSALERASPAWKRFFRGIRERADIARRVATFEKASLKLPQCLSSRPTPQRRGSTPGRQG
jgi:energy-coupling factor transporter ATP-binding protein EcfA2